MSSHHQLSQVLAFKGSVSLEQTIGLIGTCLSVLGLIAILFGLPWGFRYGIIVVALVYGPSISLLKRYSSLSLLECFVYGLGTNVSLIMVLSLAMVMAHFWHPLPASLFLLALGLIGGLMSALARGKSKEGRES